MSVQVRIFGGVDVVLGDQVIELGHPRQRCVLAALVAQANQPVPVDDLVDQVWGDNPPPHARDALYTYMSRLRAALAATPDVLIAHDARGYRLTVDDATIDLHLFRALVAQARAETDDHSALTLLDQALALASGEPFADLDSAWLAEQRSAVTAERYAAELDRTDLALRYGRYADLVGELSVRVAQHPLDERVAGQYLLALYRTGRQADAIIHYQRLRGGLAEQLGSRPTPALQAVYHQILTGEGANRPASSPPAPIPRQLPPAPAWFTGREPELAALNRLMDTTTTAGRTVVISAIAGTGGIGKTWLALHWAYQHLDQFPDGQLFVDLRGFTPAGLPVTPADAVRGFLDGLGVPSDRIPVDPAAQTELYHTTIAGKRTLIVLDNAANAAQITPLLPGNDTCTVLITSRQQLTDRTAGHIRLDILTEQEARDLLSIRLGVDRVTAEAKAVETLLACCGGFPLALGIVIGRALTHPEFPLSVLAAELNDHTSAMEALDTGEATASLSTVLSWSVRSLTIDQARVFALLGIAPGPDISQPAVAALTALSAEQTIAVLRGLETASLIQQHTPGRYRMHDLVRRYASDTADHDLAPDVRQAALRRVLDFYLHTSYTANRLLSPHRSRITLEPAQAGAMPESLATADDAMAWYQAEDAVLMAAVDYAAHHGFPTQGWQLPWTLADFFDNHGRWQDHVTTHETALTAARTTGDPIALARTHINLGVAYRALRRLDDAFAQQQHALTICETIGHELVASVHHALALTREAQGRHAESIDHDQKALQYFRAFGVKGGEARVLNLQGWNYAQLGDHAAAFACCCAALDICRDVGDRRAEARTVDSIAYICHLSGEYDQAIVHYQQAIRLFQDIGYRPDEADTLVRLGDSHLAAGDHDSARIVWQQALILHQEMDDPNLAATHAKLAALNAEATEP